MSLTSVAVKAARPRSCAYKMADERGLFLFVAPTGLKSFRLKFRLGGKEQLLVIGRYPEISLSDARARRDEARMQLGRGEDPRGALRAASSTDTFEAIARAWHETRRARWSAEHAGDVIDSLETHIFPALGRRRLDEIDAPALLEVLQAVEAAGAIETARRLRQRVDKIFAFGKTRKLAGGNPAADLVDELAPAPAVRRQPAIATVGEARALVEAIGASSAGEALKLASRFLALTAVRWGALRGATWEEIEDLDGDEPVWRVPAARMKLKLAKKGSADNDHLVTLSAPAVDIVRRARALWPDAVYIFPGRADDRQIGHGALRDLYADLGYAGRHVPHGWRSTFSTIMNELHPEYQAAIDRALAHASKDRVEAAYNRSTQLARRRWVFDRWAELLLGDAD